MQTLRLLGQKLIEQPVGFGGPQWRTRAADLLGQLDAAAAVLKVALERATMPALSA